MVNSSVQGTLQRQGNVAVLFSRRAINHVQVDVLKACSDRFARGIEGAARRVGPLQYRKHARRSGLHAEREAGKAGVEKPGEILRRRGLRVGFRGDFHARGQAKGVANAAQNSAEPVGAQQARRAATNKNGLRFAAHLSRRHLQLFL